MVEWKKMKASEIELEADEVAVITVSTDWCGPCKTLEKESLEVIADLEHQSEEELDNLTLIIIDGDEPENEGFMDMFNVDGFPFWFVMYGVMDEEAGEVVITPVYVGQFGWPHNGRELLAQLLMSLL